MTTPILTRLAILEQVLVEGLRVGLPEPDTQASLDPSGGVTLQWRSSTAVHEWATHFAMEPGEHIVYGDKTRRHTAAQGLAGDAKTTIRFVSVEEVPR